MFINLSNHPSTLWGTEQTNAAKAYGNIMDIPFPVVDPNGDEAYIKNLADEYSQKVTETANSQTIVVHVMGEMTLTFALVTKLRNAGIKCVASTTERTIQQHPDGRKESVFRFIGFREYLW